jgi:dTDP-4-dehydrorhamnose 3,5-epimerase
MFFLPKGMAHGFVTLEKDSILEYFMDEVYAPELASGVRWDDPKIGIKWPVKRPIMAEKDGEWELL